MGEKHLYFLHTFKCTSLHHLFLHDFLPRAPATRAVLTFYQLPATSYQELQLRYQGSQTHNTSFFLFPTASELLLFYTQLCDLAGNRQICAAITPAERQQFSACHPATAACSANTSAPSTRAPPPEPRTAQARALDKATHAKPAVATAANFKKATCGDRPPRSPYPKRMYRKRKAIPNASECEAGEQRSACVSHAKRELG